MRFRTKTPTTVVRKIRFWTGLGFLCLVGTVLVDALAIRSTNVGVYHQVIEWALVLTAGYVVYKLFSISQDNIVHPLQETAEFLEKMAEGRFHQMIEVLGDDEIGRVRTSINSVAQKVNDMSRVVEEINSGATFEDTFDYIFEALQKHLPYDRMGVALLEDNETIRAVRARATNPVRLKTGYSEPIGRGSLGQVIESGQPRILNNLPQYLAEHPDSKSTGLIVEEGMSSSITLPLQVGRQCIGVLFFSSVHVNAYSPHHAEFLKQVAGHLALSVDKGMLIGQLVLSAVTGFAKLAELRDEDTGLHLRRMALYARIVADELSNHPDFAREVTEGFVRAIYDFSPLHDIGKVGIPDGILQKPGKLTPEEYKVIQRHVQIGGDILAEAEEELRKNNRTFFKMAIEIARYHHEKFDGSGYPQGLSGDSIPLSARIVAAADVFDALTSRRPYKEPFSLEESRGILLKGRGSHFDPRVVDALIARWDEVVRVAHRYGDVPEDVDTDVRTEMTISA